MPCGFRDPRRQTYRCLHCRENHKKCDSGRPCRHCKQRNLKCCSLPVPRPDMMIIAYQPRARKQTVSRVLIDDSWLHLRVFFDAIKSTNSILLDPRQFEKIGQLFQDNASVFDAISTFSAIYANQISRQPMDQRKLVAFRQKITSEMYQPHTLHDPTFLLRFLLLTLMELMTDETGTRWNLLVQYFRRYFPLGEYIANQSGAVDASLLRSLRLSTVFHDLVGEDYSVSPSLEDISCNIPWKFGPDAQFFTSTEEALDFLVRMLERWVYLEKQSSKWKKSMKTLQKSQHGNALSLYQPLEPETLSPQALEGLEIISMACKLQQEIISKMLISSTSFSLSNDQSGEFLVPFYHWILTGLCHMFTSPLWRYYDWKLPVMESPLMNEQALLALGGAEKMLERSHLDAVMYATISPVVGGKISSDIDRERLITFLRNVKEKGFAVASSFEEEIKLGWAKPKNE